MTPKAKGSWSMNPVAKVYFPCLGLGHYDLKVVIHYTCKVFPT